MIKFKIKEEMPEKEKEFFNLKDNIQVKEVIPLECKSLNGANDYEYLANIYRWYIDDNNILLSEEFINRFYEKEI